MTICHLLASWCSSLLSIRRLVVVPSHHLSKSPFSPFLYHHALAKTRHLLISILLLNRMREDTGEILAGAQFRRLAQSPVHLHLKRTDLPPQEMCSRRCK